MSTGDLHVREPSVAIYGASGHTANLIARELRRRGIEARLGARNTTAARLASELGYEFAELDLSNETALNGFLQGVAVVLNCAGPFGATAPLLAKAAVERGVHYIDITGEPPVVEHLCGELHEAAVAANRYILPATGFFGALSDLLATAALGAVPGANRVRIAYYLSSWRMTRGSALAASGLRGRQFRHQNGSLVKTEGAPLISRHHFPAPIGGADVIDCYPAPEIILLPRHSGVPNVEAVMSVATFAGAAQAGGLDSTEFMIEVEAVGHAGRAQSVVTGRDIYGITAPIVAETTQRLLCHDAGGGGVATPAQVFEAADFLNAIADRLTRLKIPGRK
ncbi:saccharopine dehydrogenase NADP-binding domain-containing protein [Bradyrhizobium sp. 149]|uniref:saccharopine dehydrogenase NADP-binding domain-containing protein n=1 Tax=Bradyrhizobium sp. 149 TaxID=2782624 RepID=UPI001FF78D6C|nr:saccharopine dehydrogenase NADP-binding domain-containing protein [Bradyrhizobium sp. 149]